MQIQAENTASVAAETVEAKAQLQVALARIETLEAALKEIKFMTTEAGGAERAEALIDEVLAGGEDE